jgi:hypothetical protein
MAALCGAEVLEAETTWGVAVAGIDAYATTSPPAR